MAGKITVLNKQGQSYSVDVSSLPQAEALGISPLGPSWHQYQVFSPICNVTIDVNCTFANVTDALAHEPAPNDYSPAGIDTGSVTTIPGLGPITSFVDAQAGTVINVTDQSHYLSPGIVVQQIAQVGDTIKLQSTGVGTGRLGAVNVALASEVWGLEAQLVANIAHVGPLYNSDFSLAGLGLPADAESNPSSVNHISNKTLDPAQLASLPINNNVIGFGSPADPGNWGQDGWGGDKDTTPANYSANEGWGQDSPSEHVPITTFGSYNQGVNQPTIGPAGTAVPDSVGSPGVDAGGQNQTAPESTAVPSADATSSPTAPAATPTGSNAFGADGSNPDASVSGTGNAANPQGVSPGVNGLGDPGANGTGGGEGYPLVLNLSGQAVHTTDLATSTVTFDYAGAGHGVRTGWILPGEAFLVEDPNNAAITSGSQMVANFGQLSAFDTDGNGQLSAAEADAAGLRLWLAQGDANGANVGQIETLSQAGVASIGIQATTEGLYDNGNLISADASVAFANGSTGHIADTALMYGNALDHGMVYATEQGLTLRQADGTAVTLFTGQNATIDTGASGLSGIIDAGSGNTFVASGKNAVVFGGDGSTLDAGTALNAVLIGYGNNVTLTGNANATTLVTLGDDSTIVAGTGSNTIYVEGDHTNVYAQQGVDGVTVDSTGNTVTLGQGDTAVLNGAGNGLTGGSANDVTLVGTGNDVALDHSAVHLAAGVSASVAGWYDQVDGAGQDTLVLGASGSTTALDGSGTSSPSAARAISPRSWAMAPA